MVEGGFFLEIETGLSDWRELPCSIVIATPKNSRRCRVTDYRSSHLAIVDIKRLGPVRPIAAAIHLPIREDVFVALHSPHLQSSWFELFALVRLLSDIDLPRSKLFRTSGQSEFQEPSCF